MRRTGYEENSPDSPDIDSSGDTGKTPSGPILQDRPGPEMEITACPPVPPPSSNSPPLQIGHNREITHRYQVFISISSDEPNSRFQGRDVFRDQYRA